MKLTDFNLFGQKTKKLVNFSYLSFENIIKLMSYVSIYKTYVLSFYKSKLAPLPCFIYLDSRLTIPTSKLFN